MVNEFNFRYPYQAVGFHSGWNTYNNLPTMRLSLSKRLRLKLRKHDYVVLKKKKDIPEFYMKSKKGSKQGLSSGVGSSIIKYKEEYYKLKRNGFKDKGIIKENICDREFKINAGGLNESTSYEDGGAYSLEDAKREIKMDALLRKKGFILPQKIVGVYNIKNIYDKDSVSLIFEIESEFRADEYFLMILTNIFYDIFKSKARFIFLKDEFTFPKYNLKKSLQIIDNYSFFIKELGISIGSLYRKLHNKGVIRGIGNSWYGNEIICKSGEVGICDLESAFTNKEIKDKNTFDILKETDVNLALTAIYESMNCFENSIASFAGGLLINSFKEGYASKRIYKLKRENINKIISRYLKIYKKIFI